MRPALQRSLLLTALVAWCLILLGYRMARSGELGFRFLPWNLFLASVPAVAAALFRQAYDARWPRLIVAGLFGVWLLFLPNAPYLITDFIHLKERPEMPIWYDIALLATAAGVGILLAYASAADVQHVVTRAFGRAVAWGVIAFSLLLSGFGIYLGRFLRWNSWDVVSRPRVLLHDIAVRVTSPDDRTAGVTLIYGISLLLGYVALRVYALSTARREGERS